MLKSQTIFWVSMGITLLVALVYLSIGCDEEGVSLFFGAFTLPMENVEEGSPGATKMYTIIFTKLIAPYWLAWGAIFLGLFSCGSIFSSSLEEGAAGMLLTKKPSRWKVFLTKYAGSLFFVGIQVSVFVLIVIATLRMRTGEWNLSILIYVPVGVLVFSYLYSFMVLISVKTKSTMTALVLTIFLSVVMSIFVKIDKFVLYPGALGDQYHESLETDVPASPPHSDEDGLERIEAMSESDELGLMVKRSIEDLEPAPWYSKVKFFYGFFPKPGPTMGATDRVVVVNGERGGAKGDFFAEIEKISRGEEISPVVDLFGKLSERHSLFYIFGTSSAFMFGMILWAGWIFQRKEI